MRMRKHMWKFSDVFLFISVSSCSSTLNKRKCGTVDQPWSVSESIYDFRVRKWQFKLSLYNNESSSYSYGILL